MMPYAADWERIGDVPGGARVYVPRHDYVLTMPRGSLRQICSCQLPHSESLSSVARENTQETRYT